MLFFYGSMHDMRRRPIELSTYWERSTYEYATTLFDDYDLTKISNPTKLIQNKTRRIRRNGRSRISTADESIELQTLKQSQTPSQPKTNIDLDSQNHYHHQQQQDLLPLLTRLHTILPPELRDIIYTHIIAHDSQIYTFQPPNLLFRLDTEASVAPVSIIPESLLKLEKSSPSPTDPLVALAALTVSELTSHVLRSKTWFLRYRYDGALLDFVRDPGVYIGGAVGSVRPTVQPRPVSEAIAEVSPPPFTHVQILISPPASPEDDSCYDEEFEYPWSALFPSPRNARCAELRAQLYRDICALADLIGPDCRVELLVFVGCDDEARDLLGEEGEGGMRGFLRERGRGGGVVVRWVDAGFEEGVLERLGI